jgi:spore coat protein CotH
MMKRWIFACVVGIGSIALGDVATISPLLPAARNASADAAPAVFKTDALHTLHLKLTRKAWDDMQPTRKSLFSGLFGKHPADEEEPHESPFGYQYSFVHASLDYNGQTFDDIGLRFKGNSSYLTGKGLKKPFKLSLNRFNENQTLAGLAEINLNNNAMDGTLMREALSYQFFRDVGVPASRTSSALVYVSVEKLHEHKLAGLYTLVEEIDKPFLKKHFGSAKGLLLKPENALNLPYQGETFDRYERMYRPKSKVTPELSKRFVEFIKLIHQADDATFDKQIESYLDVPGFLRFVAANAMLANMDSFLSTGHNFYLYMDPDARKIHFIPWDLNLSFGTFDWVGTTREQTELSLRQPYVKPNRLTERVLSISRFAKAYKEETARIAKTVLTTERFNKQIAELEAVVAKAERQAGVTHKAPDTARNPELDLRTFMARRVKSVQAQIAELNEGYAPHWSKGIFGGFGAKPATKPTTRPAKLNKSGSERK